MSGPRFGLLGSGEFEQWAGEVDRWLLERAGDGRVLVAPTASAPEGEDVFLRWAQRGLEHYGSLGAEPDLLPLRTRRDADDPEVASCLEDASLVFFSGGNPAYLAATLAGTLTWERLRERMRDGLALGGCSGGVAFLGRRAPDTSVADPTAEGVWRSGLRVFDPVVFAPHWDTVDDHLPGFRAWVERTLEDAVALVTLDERTALVGDGRSWRVVGRGSIGLRLDGAWSSYREGDDLPAGVLPSPA